MRTVSKATRARISAAIKESWARRKQQRTQTEPPTEQLPAERTVDVVNHPPHYTSHPSGVECIQVTEHCNFCVGNAIKYLWRAHDKGDYVENLQKARWYINREIERVSK